MPWWACKPSRPAPELERDQVARQPDQHPAIRPPGRGRPLLAGSGPVIYYPAVRQIAAAKNLDVTDSTRFMALVSVARADAWIAALDAKYHYDNSETLGKSCAEISPLRPFRSLCLSTPFRLEISAAKRRTRSCGMPRNRIIAPMLQ